MERWRNGFIRGGGSAAERLRQRALEGNGGIKTGTAGTHRRAERFFFSFFPPSCQAIVPYVLHLRLSEPRAKHTAGQAPPSSLIGSCHGDAVSRALKLDEEGGLGLCAGNLNVVFF